MKLLVWYKYLMNKTAASWHVFSSLFLFQSAMFLVGLSGGIASGKSTVVAVLRELGCAVIDADVIAREVVQPRLKAYQQIVRCFGPEILQESGEIDREALGNIIFSHPEKRRLLNAITHPEIQKEMLKQVLKYFVLAWQSLGQLKERRANSAVGTAPLERLATTCDCCSCQHCTAASI
uniref:Dephospho-CoA kinase domain containing n=1 Tax=Meleagris gallopavo TaxID=9103 RepID=A0A803XZK4_MELGA